MGKTMDTDETGYITKTQFLRHIEDEQVKTYFATLDLDSHDALVLFKLLDLGPDKGLDVEDFVMGCLRLKGQAKSCDMARVMYENRLMIRSLQDLHDKVDLFSGVS